MTPGPTTGPTVTSDPGPTSTATPAPTRTPLPPDTAAPTDAPPTVAPIPTVSATPVPTGTPTPTASPPPPSWTFGSLSCFAPSCSQAETRYPSTVLADLTVEATFTNPRYASQFQYGFVIRDRIRIWVASDGDWEAVAWARETRSDSLNVFWRVASTAGGSLDVPFDTSPSGKNHVRVTAKGERVCLFVNGEAAACVDLPEFTMAGEVSIASQYGRVPYRGFRVAAFQEAG